MECLTRLGPNKVNQAIKPNKYSETEVFTVEHKNGFEEIPDLIESVRMLKNGAGATGKPVEVTGIPSLYLIFAKIADPSMSLFNGEQLLQKLKYFQDSIIKAWPLKKKELGLSKSKISESNLYEDKYAVLLYCSKLFKKNIFYEDDKTHFWPVDDDGPALHVTYSNDVYTLNDVNLDRKTCYQLLAKGFETKLVKDLREIASMLSIPIYDDSKKLLLKKDLIDAIKLKL